ARLLELKKKLDHELQNRQRSQPVPPAKLPESEAAVPGQAPRSPVLHVESSPLGANITIDGEERGVTPVQITLSEGSHTLGYSLKGYQAGRQTVDLSGGETKTVTVVLSPLPVPVQEEKPPEVIEIQTPREKEIDISAPSGSVIQEKTQKQARQKPFSPPLQKQETRSGGAKFEKRNIFLLLLLTAALSGLFILRKYKTLPSQPIVSSAMSDPANAQLLDDEVTQDLRLEDFKQNIKIHSKELPQGTPKSLGQYE
ncbi:MAG TPA: PEGA domain-containing protein, partial [Acidobacteriota bacterium]|nr:PEGA domain-containing protein [Acidobacteriota bacterium]